MDFFDAVHNRHCYRKAFKDQPVPREDLRKIMEAGLAAPSGCNTQTTSLIGVDDPALMAQLFAVLGNQHFQPIPAAIAVLGKDIEGRIAGRWYVQDYAAAIENMLLSITALGYASCWIEGDITMDGKKNAAMRKVLDVPEEYKLVALLPVGVPEGEVRGPQKMGFEERAWFNRG